MGAEMWWHVATIIALVLAAAEAILLLGLTRVVAPLVTGSGPRQSAERGVAVGTIMPAMRLPAADDGCLQPVIGDGIDRVVLFISPSCHVCTTVLPTLQPAITQSGRRWEVVAVVCGPRAAAEEYARAIDPRIRTLLDPDSAVESAFATGRAYPFAFAVSSEGIVRARGVGGSWERLNHLVAEGAGAGRFTSEAVITSVVAADRSVVTRG
jgi:hypothetical protein